MEVIIIGLVLIAVGVIVFAGFRLGREPYSRLVDAAHLVEAAQCGPDECACECYDRGYRHGWGAHA